ncbi:MAG: IniB N-terminal domain-containing protein [Pseudonocardia sp.]
MTFQDIIDYLMSLLRDEDARAAFEQDPQGSLAAAGLQDVTADDIRDARLQLADTGAVSGSGSSGGGWSGGSDPIHELHQTTRHFTAVPTAEVGATFIDQRTFIDDRDITVEDNDTTIVSDSFNSDDDVVAIDNSVDNSVDNSIDVVTAVQDNSVENNVVDNSVENSTETTVVDNSIDVGNASDLDPSDDGPGDEVAVEEPEPLPDPEPDPEPDLDAGAELDPDPATTAV